MTSSEVWVYLKGHLFWAFSVLLLVTIIFLDWTDLEDPCLIFYGLQWSTALISGVLLHNYLRRRRGASKIYWWIVILLYAIALDSGIMFVARYVLVYHGAVYLDLVNSVWWGYRSVFKTLALLFLLLFALKQRYGSGGTYYDSVRQDMANGFENLEAKIVAGEIKFTGHSHDGLALEAKIIIKPPVNAAPASTVTETETVTTTTTTTKTPEAL